MKSIEDLLKNLARPEVLEFGLVTNRLPSVNIGGKFEPVDDEAPSTRILLDMLSTLSGERHVPLLGDKPLQWTHRMEGIGVVAVAAILRKDVIQARFTLAKRDARISLPPGASYTQSGPPPQPRPIERTSQPPQVAPATSPFRTTQQGTGPASSPAPPRTASVPPSQRAPYEQEGGDDDEPTVQTSAPPVKGKPGQLAKAEPPKTVATPSGPPAPPPIALDPEPSPAPKPTAAAPPSSQKPLRILTPTSVDVVEIDQAQNVAAAKRVAEGSSGHTEPLPAPPVRGATVEISAPWTTGPLPSAVPVTLPTPEKERPRVEGPEAIFALAGRATDIHVTSGRPALVRIAGELVPRTQAVSADVVERFAREIVPVRSRDVLANEGACDFAFEHPQHGRFRVNVSRQRTGIKVSLRIVPRDAPSIVSLGLPEMLASIAKLTQGLVLITSPVGQGKSATLAAIVDHLNRETASHVLTIEDPIEIVHAKKRALVSQREIGVHARSIGSALSASAVEDVDVLVFGELRDTATTRAAVAAAETGRLVMATMPASGAARALERVVDAFPVDELPRARARIASMVRLVTCQRLVPSIDRGRLHAAVEILPSTLALANLVREGKLDQIHALQQRARGVSMRLDEALAELVVAQKVSVESARQVAESAVELDALVARRAEARRA